MLAWLFSQDKFLEKELLGQNLCTLKSFGAHSPIWPVEIWIHWNSHQQDESVVSLLLCQHWEWEMEEYIKLLASGRWVYPPNRQWKKFLQDIAFGYLSSGTAGVICRPVGFPRAQRVSGQLTGNKFLGWEGAGVLQDPGIREGLLLSEPEARASHETEKKQAMRMRWDLNLTGTCLRGQLLELAREGILGECLRLGERTWLGHG